MKTRHIIMMVTIILFTFVILVLNDSRNTEKLTCTEKGTFLELDSTTTIKMKVKKSKVKAVDITIDAIVPEDLASQKQNLITSTNSSGKMKATVTEEGIRFQTNIQSEYFNALNLNTKASFGELKSALESLGFTCEKND